jgi:uncharacterized RDD family membrane protein YckC
MSETRTDRAYHVSHNGEKFGPISGFELSRRRLTADMMIWWRGLPEWIPIVDVPELSPYVTFTPVHPTMAPPRRGFVEASRTSTGPPPLPSLESGTVAVQGPSAIVLAGRSARLAAVLIDGIITAVLIAPFAYVSGYSGRITAGLATASEEFTWSLLSCLVFMAIQGHWLATRGQTIGKVLMQIQIVDAETHQLLPFIRVAVYRYLWLLPLNAVIAMIPGHLDSLLISAVGLLDAILIFGSARRCLHDYIAGSVVVAYQPGRLHVGSIGRDQRRSPGI